MVPDWLINDQVTPNSDWSAFQLFGYLNFVSCSSYFSAYMSSQLWAELLLQLSGLAPAAMVFKVMPRSDWLII